MGQGRFFFYSESRGIERKILKAEYPRAGGLLNGRDANHPIL
jgi:hypothetical protein